MARSSDAERAALTGKAPDTPLANEAGGSVVVGHQRVCCVRIQA